MRFHEHKVCTPTEYRENVRLFGIINRLPYKTIIKDFIKYYTTYYLRDQKK